MKKLYNDLNWRRIGKIALLAIPVLLWDATYFLITKIYEGCTYIDKKGEKFLDGFMEK